MLQFTLVGFSQAKLEMSVPVPELNINNKQTDKLN